jgi:asparaginyl-tRNA synthetase
MFGVTTLLPKNSEKFDNKSIDYSKDFFNKPVFLTCSGQLELETYVCGMGDVYSFGPTFHAEKDLGSSRHLAEYWMVEPEICFADLNDLMDLAENYIKFCLKYILEKNKFDLEFLGNNYDKNLVENIEQIINIDFKRISYSEVIDILLEACKSKKNLFVDKVTWGINLSLEHEKFLTENVFKSPIFIYNHPKRINPFYTRLNDDEETIASMDLLLPKLGKILRGSQREERYKILKESISKTFNDNSHKYNFYLDLRKYGGIPHSGFGMGFDRLVMLATGMSNIKDAIPYPRYLNHAEF